MLHRVVKKNDVNKDKWIGVGGHFERDESPEECLLREVREETGYTLTSYRFRGIVTFVSGDGVTEYMHLFTADGFTGEPIECDEGVLEWVPKEEISGLNIWEGDKIFFRLLTEDRSKERLPGRKAPLRRLPQRPERWTPEKPLRRALQRPERWLPEKPLRRAPQRWKMRQRSYLSRAAEQRRQTGKGPGKRARS